MFKSNVFDWLIIICFSKNQFIENWPAILLESYLFKLRVVRTEFLFAKK